MEREEEGFFWGDIFDDVKESTWYEEQEEGQTHIRNL